MMYQNHALFKCQPLNTQHKQTTNIEHPSLFSSQSKQLEAIEFTKYVDHIIEHLKDNILLGGCCGDLCKFDSIVLGDCNSFTSVVNMKKKKKKNLPSPSQLTQKHTRVT